MLVRLATLSVYLHPEDPDKQATNNAMVNCRGLAAVRHILNAQGGF
jgi:hypothetical protein